MARHRLLLLGILALVGCAPSALPPLTSTHPASPEAAEAPVPEPPDTLLGTPPAPDHPDGPAGARHAH